MTDDLLELKPIFFSGFRAKSLTDVDFERSIFEFKYSRKLSEEDRFGGLRFAIDSGVYEAEGRLDGKVVYFTVDNMEHHTPDVTKLQLWSTILIDSPKLASSTVK